MPASELSRSGPRKTAGPFFLIALVPAALFFLVFIPNPLTDTLVSRVCASAVGRPVVLRGVRYEFHAKPYMIFQVREIDLRPLWQGQDSPARRFLQKQGLDAWFLVKRSRWVLKPRQSVLYLRLLEASAGEASIKGGLRSDSGSVSKWNLSLRLPRTVWGRFPGEVEKKFAQDVSGRRLFKLTWCKGFWRLWGRFGPALEARWQ